MINAEEAKALSTGTVERLLLEINDAIVREAKRHQRFVRMETLFWCKEAANSLRLPEFWTDSTILFIQVCDEVRKLGYTVEVKATPYMDYYLEIRW